VKFRRRLSDLIARSPRLTALIVWYVWRRYPEARPGLYTLLYRRNEGGDDDAATDT